MGTHFKIGKRLTKICLRFVYIRRIFRLTILHMGGHCSELSYVYSIYSEREKKFNAYISVIDSKYRITINEIKQNSKKKKKNTQSFPFKNDSLIMYIHFRIASIISIYASVSSVYFIVIMNKPLYLWMSRSKHLMCGAKFK